MEAESKAGKGIEAGAAPGSNTMQAPVKTYSLGCAGTLVLQTTKKVCKAAPAPQLPRPRSCVWQAATVCGTGRPPGWPGLQNYARGSLDANGTGPSGRCLPGRREGHSTAIYSEPGHMAGC